MRRARLRRHGLRGCRGGATQGGTRRGAGCAPRGRRGAHLVGVAAGPGGGGRRRGVDALPDALGDVRVTVAVRDRAVALPVAERAVARGAAVDPARRRVGLAGGVGRRHRLVRQARPDPGDDRRWGLVVDACCTGRPAGACTARPACGVRLVKPSCRLLGAIDDHCVKRISHVLIREVAVMGIAFRISCSPGVGRRPNRISHNVSRGVVRYPNRISHIAPHGVGPP